MNIYKHSEESRELSEILFTKMRELRYLTNVVENIPYTQVAPVDFIKKQNKLYKLDYTSYYGFATSVTYKYMFSKEILEKLVKVMKNINKKIREELKETIKELEFECLTKEYIENTINCFGYDEFEIQDISHKVHHVYKKTELPKREIPYEVQCEYCGDGGCIHCEPYRFL